MFVFHVGIPNFIKSPDDQTGIYGGVASFICQATGDPKPLITWKKEGKKVNSQRFEVKEFDDKSGSVLRIQPLKTNRDEAIYECTASNSVGAIAAPAKLIVLEDDQIPAGFPNIDMGPQLKVVVRTNTATMLCAASGNPDPEIFWFKDMLPVDISSSNGRIKQLWSGALQIENSDESDQGKYECVAVNSAGTRFSSPANLYVRGKISVRRVPPRFSIPPTNCEVMPAGSVNLTCVAVGSPMPLVKWMSDEVELTQEDELPFGRNILQLTNIQQSANYTCVAISTLGRIETTAQVFVKALPKMPTFLQVVETTATSVTLTWKSGNAEPVSYYLVQYRSKTSGNGFQEIDGVASTRYSIGGLSPFSEYEFRVLASNSVGRGPPSRIVEICTGEQAPSSPPLHVRARLLSSTTILVEWESPEEPNGQLQGYRIFYSSEPSNPLSTWQIHNINDSKFTSISGLTPTTTYSLRMLGFTSMGDGPLSDVLQTTSTSVPGELRFARLDLRCSLSYLPYLSITHTCNLMTLSSLWCNMFENDPHLSSVFVKNFDVKAVMKTSVLLSWEVLETYKYQIQLKILYNNQKVEIQGDLKKKLITQLQPDTYYSFVLKSYGNGAGDLQQQVSVRTAPDLLSVKPTRYQPTVDEDRVTIVMPEVPAETLVSLERWENPEDIDIYEILEADADNSGQTHSQDFLQPFIVAKMAVLPEIFMLADEKKYNGYYNRPLPILQQFRCFVLADLKDLESVSIPCDPEMLWVVGPVLAVIIIIITVIAILLFKSQDISFLLLLLISVFSGMRDLPPIPVCDLADHIERQKANDSLLFSQEFQTIDPEQQLTWEHSNLEINRSKNRYANVIAYDHSRVCKYLLSTVRYNYINANYINGYRKQNAYIATQGPLPETICDFWRMVWEQRSCTIVMMTRLKETSRCDQYWPSRGTETYGTIQVTILETLELATYVTRIFSIYKNESCEKREVQQLQFLAWPDHGVPEHPTTALAFLHRTKSCNSPDAGPMVVHCSAGVGRTGCFIAIDAMLERMKYERSVDIYGYVTCMRAQRNYMVQTLDQYMFIHEALLEAATCGKTEVPARGLYTHLQKLTQNVPRENLTAMEQEFKVSSFFHKTSTQRCISANLPWNTFKNRLANIMPFESNRVCLQPIRGIEGSDYINASFIDGYRHQKAYIATQGPLAQTTEDLWRMLWEHNSTIVVMLTKLHEMGREKCHQYWPVALSTRYQHFVVDPVAEYNMPEYILREFKVTDARDGQSRTIRQFQYTHWQEQGVPKTVEDFINFIGQVHKTKEQLGQDGPITVHCSAGVGRTGVFITLSIVLERLRYEGVVDIFQTVKILQTQRPAMVQTEEQYHMCYRAALEYLGSFDVYAM
uniref:Receptor-type tyrosine-protein phosphatase F n=1 Tax=Xiphophorus maculatus TaxID=8083 RepID=A0A3B5QYJ1_XIPMA